MHQSCSARWPCRRWSRSTSSWRSTPRFRCIDTGRRRSPGLSVPGDSSRCQRSRRASSSDSQMCMRCCSRLRRRSFPNCTRTCSCRCCREPSSRHRCPTRCSNCRSCRSWCTQAGSNSRRSRCPCRCRCTCHRRPRRQFPGLGWCTRPATRRCSIGTLPCTPNRSTRHRCRTRSRTDSHLRRPAHPSFSQHRQCRCNSACPCTERQWCTS